MTPLSGLITKGFGLHACQGFITYRYTLFCNVDLLITPGGGGGGPYPGPAWNRIAPGKSSSFFKPVNPAFFLPKHLADKFHHVILRVAYNGRVYEKNFLVKNKTAEVMVKVLNVTSKYVKTVSIIADNFKHFVKRKAVMPLIARVTSVKRYLTSRDK